MRLFLPINRKQHLEFIRPRPVLSETPLGRESSYVTILHQLVRRRKGFSFFFFWTSVRRWRTGQGGGGEPDAEWIALP